MNNSVFGKTVENLQKRVDVKLVTDEKKLMKLTSKPTFVTSKIFNEKVVAVHKIKETLTLTNRVPAYVGMWGGGGGGQVGVLNHAITPSLSI